MNRRKAYFYTALGVSVAVMALLITGSFVLTIPLDQEGRVPLGTFITWAGMISLPLSVYWGVKDVRRPSTKLQVILSITLKIIIILGLCWVPISYFLAGNLSFTFSEKATFQGGQSAMRWFWILSYGIGAGTLLVLIVHWVSLLLRR
jgi:hypothetical protein